MEASSVGQKIHFAACIAFLVSLTFLSVHAEAQATPSNRAALSRSLLAAAEAGDVNAAKAALAAGAPPNAVDDAGKTALEFTAPASGNLRDYTYSNEVEPRFSLIRLLIARGADPKRIKDDVVASNIVMSALAYRHYDIAENFLSRGLGEKGFQYWSLLQTSPAALGVGPNLEQRRLFQRLLQKPQSRKDYSQALMPAVGASDAAYFVKGLLAKGADANLRNGLGETPLIAAIRLQKMSLVKMLLDSGADATLPIQIVSGSYTTSLEKYNGYTPLMFAKESKNTAIIALLRAKGAVR